MAITNHIKGAVEKFKAKTGTELKDHVLNATYLNGLEGTSYVDLTSDQMITGTKTFDVAYANVFATGTGEGNYFQCRKFRGEGNASTYYHALDFGYAGHNQWDFFEYGGIYNFYQNTTADGSGKVNLFQISPDGVTSHKPLIAESTLTAKGAFTSSASTTLSNIKNAGILGTDSSGKVYDNSSAYQKAGNYVTIDTAQTITGRKTFNSPANVNGQEVATAIFKTSNGGQLIIGKEGHNSGTMLRFDQTAGTTRLQFRASATPGAMVWTQPEKGAKLYFDLTNSAGVSTRTTLDARSGTIARTSDIGNGKITIQKNGTEVGSFTTNQSGSKTINLTLAKSDVGLGNVDNTADKDKSVKHASSAGTATNLKDSDHSYTATDVYDYLRFKEQKIAYRAIANRCDLAMALADLTKRQHKNYGGSLYDQLYHQPGYVQVTVALDDDAEPLPNKFSNPSIGGYSEIVALTLDISDMIPASSEIYPPNPYMFFLLKHITDVQGNSGFYGSSPIVSGPKGAYGNDTVTFNVDLWFPDSQWERKRGTATITCNATTSNIAGVYATKDELTDGLDTKANSSHTHSISQITNLQSTLNGKANASHTHTISQITNLQTTLDNKQNKIEYPCSFSGSNGNYVKLIRAGTNNYYVEIERGSVTYNGSTTQYPEINVTFPREFSYPPTVIVSFAPTSNSTGTYEALKVINVTSTGFTVITRMSASISGGYFRVNWIAIYTV